MTVQSLKVGKREAARRQLETAALLVFNSGDPVAIHTLAAAAHQVLADLGAKEGSKGLVDGALEAIDDKELVAELRYYMREPQNYFKHADKEDKPEVEFSPGYAHLLIADGYAMLSQQTGEHPMVLRAFEKWFFMKHPELLARTPELARLNALATEHFGSMSPLAFFQEFTKHASEMKR